MALPDPRRRSPRRMSVEELEQLRESLLRQELPSQYELVRICDRLCQYAHEFHVQDVLIYLQMSLKLELQQPPGHLMRYSTQESLSADQVHKLELRKLAADLVKTLDKVEEAVRRRQAQIQALLQRCRVDAFAYENGKCVIATKEEVELLKESFDDNWQYTRIDPPGPSFFIFAPEATVFHYFDFYLQDLFLVQEERDTGIPYAEFDYHPDSKALVIAWRPSKIPLDKRRPIHVFSRRQERTIDDSKKE